MPLVKGKKLTPDEAIAQDCCPECGRDLKEVNPIAELASHWKTVPKNDSDGKEGLRRRKLLQDYIARNNVKVADPDAPDEPEKPAEPAKPAPVVA
jgi:hypothetical protein